MFGWKRRQTVPHPWDHSTPLITFGTKDVITLGNALENIAIFGGVGSGKTTGSGFAIIVAMLALGLGGIVLTAKAGDAARIRRYCEFTGRSNDLIVIDDQSDWQFNFLGYLLELQGRGGRAIENLVTMLDVTMKVSERATGLKAGQGQEAFWMQGIRKHTRNVISLAVYATGGVSVEDMLEIMRSCPRSLDQVDDSMKSESLIGKVLAMARDRNQDALSQHDLNQIEAYFFVEFPSIAERTRSVFEAGVYGILDLFSRGSLHWMFGRGTNITPAACFDGKIIVIDLPVATHGAVGLIGQSIFKFAFQQTVQQRTAEQQRPLFLVADEFQELVTVEDFRFASVSRECKVINLWLSQSVASIHAVLGGDPSGTAAVDAILGLANYKFFHSNSCPTTNTWASELIGRRRMRMRSSSINHPPHSPLEFYRDEPGFSSSTSESFEYTVMPHVFTSLKKGGKPHMQTEAILFGGGRKWHGSNESFLKVTFDQERF